jgi:cysteinyl-tRNA synthetase
LSQDVDAINKELASSAMSLNSKMNYWLHTSRFKNNTENESRSIKSISTIGKILMARTLGAFFKKLLIKQTKIS